MKFLFPLVSLSTQAPPAAAQVLERWAFGAETNGAGKITRSWFEQSGAEQTPYSEPPTPHSCAAEKLLHDRLYAACQNWASGADSPFADLPLLPAPTPFAQAVRQALLQLSRGTLISYSELAALAGNPRAVRAAASACSHNPFPLIVPCHRVVPTPTLRTWTNAKYAPEGSAIPSPAVRAQESAHTPLQPTGAAHTTRRTPPPLSISTPPINTQQSYTPSENPTPLHSHLPDLALYDFGDFAYGRQLKAALIAFECAVA